MLKWASSPHISLKLPISWRWIFIVMFWLPYCHITSLQYRWTWGWVDHKAYLNAVVERIISASAGERSRHPSWGQSLCWLSYTWLGSENLFLHDYISSESTFRINMNEDSTLEDRLSGSRSIQTKDSLWKDFFGWSSIFNHVNLITEEWFLYLYEIKCFPRHMFFKLIYFIQYLTYLMC